MKKDKVASILLIIVGILAVVYANEIVILTRLNEPGPKLFPYISGIGIIVCSIGMFVSSSNVKNNKTFLTDEGWRKLGVIAAILIAYAIALTVVGFLVATPIGIITFILVLREKKKISWKLSITLALLMTGGVYYLFEKVFLIFLPPGILF